MHKCQSTFNFSTQVLRPTIKNMTFHSHSDRSGYSGFRDPALLNDSIPTGAHTLWCGNSKSSAQLFASTGSAMLSTTSTSLLKLVPGHAMPNLLSGNPNSKEMEVELDSTLFIISAKSSRFRNQLTRVSYSTLEIRRLLLNIFCMLNEEHCSGSPSFTCLSNGRAHATPIAAAQDGKWDNTLKRWPRMKRLDESRRTFPGLTNHTLQ